MGIKTDKKKREVAEWFDALARYAKGERLPLRIMDDLEECRGAALSGETEWAVVSSSVEELLETIEEKMTPSAVQETAEMGVSAEDIMTQLEKMARRCHSENTASVDSMGERKNTVIRKMYGQLSEISHTKSHLEELKNEDQYLQFFAQCKAAYESDVFGMMRELLQSISDNYGYMLNQMKSMFQSIGGYRKGIGNETFYLEYEARRSGIDQRVLGETQTEDVGGGDLISFGQKTKETVRKIARKLMRKRKILAWVPICVLLCFCVTASITRQEQSRQAVQNTEQTQENENSLEKGIKLDFVTKFSLFSALSVTFGTMALFVLLLIILLYVCYLNILKWWCDHQICKRCGEYILTELSRFEKENGLSFKLDTVMRNAADEYERQYLEVLHQLLTGTDYGEQNDGTEWGALRERWDTLKGC